MGQIKNINTGVPSAEGSRLGATGATSDLGPFEHAGVPVNGGSGTLKRTAAAGALLIDKTNKTLYQNTGTKSSPTWTIFGPGAVAANVPVIGTTSAITSVPEEFEDEAAIQAYLAGNVISRIEGRLDAVETKIDALIGALVTAGVMSAPGP